MTEATIFKQYDLIADQYSEHIDLQKLNTLYERPYVLAQLPNLKGLTVLDAGCGTGYYSLYALNEGAKVIAIDGSARLIEKLKQGNHELLETHVADLSNGLPFVKDASVDVLICSLVLHYIADWDLLLKEFHRILKPGALLIASVHHPLFDSLFNKQRYFEKRLVHDQWSGFGRTPMNVSYYVRPLSEYVNPVIAYGWSVARFEEPRPAATVKNNDPGMFDKLSESPIFMFIKLIK